MQTQNKQQQLIWAIVPFINCIQNTKDTITDLLYNVRPSMSRPMAQAKRSGRPARMPRLGERWPAASGGLGGSNSNSEQNQPIGFVVVGSLAWRPPTWVGSLPTWVGRFGWEFFAVNQNLADGGVPATAPSISAAQRVD